MFPHCCGSIMRVKWTRVPATRGGLVGIEDCSRIEGRKMRQGINCITAAPATKETVKTPLTAVSVPGNCAGTPARRSTTALGVCTLPSVVKSAAGEAAAQSAGAARAGRAAAP